MGFAHSALKKGNYCMSDSYETIGTITEISGKATITRTDGSVEPLSLGSEVYLQDQIETFGDGAVNIGFIDDSSFSISENAKLTIDDYVFDQSTESGVSNFSLLEGIFVYSSGQIGRDDPDDVMIETPIGSIGIRGTIIAGDIGSGEIIVVEGAIVLRDFNGNEITLADQFESARFELEGQGIEHTGTKKAGEVAESFSGLSEVAPDLFSSINDVAREAQSDPDRTDETSNEGEDVLEADVTEAAEPKTVLDTDPAGQAEESVQSESSESSENTADEASTAEASETEDVIQPEALETQTKPLLNEMPDTLKTAPVERSVPRVDANKPDSQKEPTIRKALNNPNERGEELPPELLRKIEAKENLNTPEFLEGNKPLDGFGFGPKTGLEIGQSKLLVIDLDALFGNDDGDERSVEYELSAETIQALLGHSENDQIADQSSFGNSGLNLFDAEGSSAGNLPLFQIENGKLKLFINEADSLNITDGSEEIEIEVFARYEGSNSFTSGSFTLTAYDPDGSSTDNIKVGEFDGFNEAKVEGFNKVYLIEDGNGDVLVGNGGIGEAVNDSTVFLGEGGQTAIIHGVSTGNTVFGSKDADEIEVHNTDNSIDTGAGNDVITLFWGESTVRDNIENSHIDGGAGHDTLKINSPGPVSLDLTAIQNPDFIKNIETLDLSNGSQDTVILNVADVIGMTDQDNELYIYGEAGDKLLTKDENGNVSSLDENFANTGNTVQNGGETYDVWTDTSSNVTLFVDSDVSSTVV